MKVLHLITTLDVGGAEMHLLAQVRGQCARGHEVRVAWLKGAGSLAGDFAAAGAREVVAARGISAVARLWRHLRWAEVVHTHLLKADMAGALLATLAGRRAGWWRASTTTSRCCAGPVSLVHGALGRLPQRTIVLSDHVSRFIVEHGRVPLARQTRIYYGLDPAPFEAAAARAPAEDP